MLQVRKYLHERCLLSDYLWVNFMMTVAESFIREAVFQSELVKRLLVSVTDSVSLWFTQAYMKQINIDQPRMMVMVDEDICTM